MSICCGQSSTGAVLCAQEDGRQPESPLVQRGLILNERTGKTIKIGAATYNRLVLEGYPPNRAAGVLTPPAPSRSGGDIGAHLVFARH